MADEEAELSLVDAVAMAVGGMIGGGIFAVLGEAVTTAGNAAFVSFGLAGLLALVTGASYARLTTAYDEPGGSFSYVEHLATPRLAGTVSWFLIVGYLFTVSLYSFTFGRYAGQLVGAGRGLGPWLGIGVIGLLTGVNLVGVRESGLVEDVLVYGKAALLVVLGGLGVLAVERQEALPVLEHGPTSPITAAALVFVAFEGFQLLTYDYDDIEDHQRNLPRAVWISIPFVILLYMGIAWVTTGALGSETIQQHKETVLAFVVEPVLGQVGVVAVLVAAVVSTASAIHATLFATARLGDRVADDGELPSALQRWRSGGVPVAFLALLALVAAGVQFFGSLHQITSFSSLVFLVVFAIVNAAAALHGVFEGWSRAIPVVGSLGCVAAAITLLVDLALHDRTSFAIVAGVAIVLGAVRWLYIRKAETG